MTINKSILKLVIFGGLTVASLSACTGNYMDYNTNPYEATGDEMQRDEIKWRSALVGMEGYTIPTEEHLNQFLECLLGGSYGGYFAESNPGFTNKFSTFDQSQDWNKKLYQEVIPKILPNLEQIKAATEDPIPLAVANIVKVAAIVRVTDGYGPIPYSQLGAEGKLTAPFDSQELVYTTMFKELDEAIGTLTENQTKDFNPKADKVYSGNVLKWIKFANSLKLRMAMRIVYADKTTAQQKAEEAVNHEVGVITDNADNAMMSVTSNPFRIICYDFNGGDSRIAADISSYMKGYNDPRMAKYFTKSTFKDAGLSDKISTEDDFWGLRLGIDIPAANVAQAYANMNVAATDKVLWMNAAEVAFLRAEGALRNWNMGGTAETFYREGISLSFGQWGASGADAYADDESSKPESYKDPMNTYSFEGTPSTITIKWKSADEFETNLERIITQKWIAMFPLGLEAWAEFRRTGYPKLMPSFKNKSGGDIKDGNFARRLTYPQDEYKDNAENIPGALRLLNGGDKMSTRVWWDCNPRISNN